MSDTSLANNIRNHLNAREFHQAAKVLQDKRYDARLQSECMDLVSTLADNLTPDNLRDNYDLFMSCEDLLKIVAAKCVPQEVLFELLEKIENTKNDDVFTSLLKALQIVLLRLKENKARSLEWSLNSIISYINGIKLPEYGTNFGEEEEKLLENDFTVRRILQLYMTVMLFLEPIVNEFGKLKCTSFRNTGVTRQNVVICFILQLMGKPLIYLNVHEPDQAGVKTYTRQVAEDLVFAIVKLLGDVFSLLPYGEQRMRWPQKKISHTEEIIEDSSFNIFMNDEKCPIPSLAMFNYLLLAENLLPTTCPKIYMPQYIYEKGLYYCNILMDHEHPVAHYKGILLANSLRKLLGAERLNSFNLDLDVHHHFCKALSKIIVYSNIERNRKAGTFALRDYILQFDNEGRYLLTTNLIKTTEHDGLRSFIVTIYKDMLHSELGLDNPSQWFIARRLKAVILGVICNLTKGIETDLMENSDTILSALNILIFIFIRDKNNRTAIRDYVHEIENQFLLPLRKSIDLARAHFKEEQSSVQRGEDDKSKFDISIDILNGGDIPELTKERKLDMLARALNNFDLMDCLLARVIECIGTKPTSCESKRT
ncbi:glomulin-like isoform X1 [Toxorhynchites rutilus septentrionalis]|uniref:glomulin-like isoform X1 n=1 Tax=Toxorhynchites rutilus septentrionalis TaxID=329112 RepID=UPI002479D54B|nr:glomulin-like isoform X1 [Toxorhynchites rutilus septentrionalis]XP_055624623.1 glomulin-like isoform X1 [Toxorhynchites rutilus septentrionalis]XP_055624624.1 glomulin-like isoform X1 [Toxorhynchites rutilus septentrionalis]